MNHIGSIFAMAVCLAMSAYFSATETAFSSLNKTRLKVLADNGNKRAALALKLAENYDRLISTILIGNNIVNITIASVGTLLFVELYGDVGATISTVVVTLVVLLFGEITPKSIAKDAPERFAMFSAPFIRLWIWVLTPLNFPFTQSRFSRLLVYRDTIDQVVGVLHQKDFYINGKMTDQPIAQIMTEPLFVYQHTKIRDILKMLQHQKSHIAVVVDDFGGTLGIVTMEDILEELVGEIWDEHDEVEEDFEKLGENLYRVDCSVSLEDFMEFFDVELKSDSVSVGGWVMEQLNKVPVKGESFTTKHLEITVSELDAHRVSSITVRQLDESPAGCASST